MGLTEGSDGCGFEGSYPSDRTGFAPGTRLPNCNAIPIPNSGAGCPITPNALVVQTESPVELDISNASREHVITKDGGITEQWLRQHINVWAVPEDDGTYGWTMVLPIDNYDIALDGIATGPYTLKLTSFSDSGTFTQTVIEGTTSEGQRDEFSFVEVLFSESFE